MRERSEALWARRDGEGTRENGEGDFNSVEDDEDGVVDEDEDDEGDDDDEDEDDEDDDDGVVVVSRRDVLSVGDVLRKAMAAAL